MRIRTKAEMNDFREGGEANHHRLHLDFSCIADEIAAGNNPAREIEKTHRMLQLEFIELMGARCLPEPKNTLPAHHHDDEDDAHDPMIGVVSLTTRARTFADAFALKSDSAAYMKSGIDLEIVTNHPTTQSGAFSLASDRIAFDLSHIFTESLRFAFARNQRREPVQQATAIAKR